MRLAGKLERREYKTTINKKGVSKGDNDYEEDDGEINNTGIASSVR